MKTAVEWLVSQILTDIEKYNDDCTAVVGIQYFNKFQSHVDLSEYIKQAKEMQERQLEFFYLKGYQKRAENGIYDDISATHALMEFEKLKQLTFKSE